MFSGKGFWIIFLVIVLLGAMAVLKHNIVERAKRGDNSHQTQ